MVIANGFITSSVEEAYKLVCNKCNSKVLPVPFPTVETMTYWLSEAGEMFGCQRMASMCITKPLKILRKYRRGCHMRYAIYGGKQREAFMQNVMYATFVSGEFLPDLLFTFRDGNQYNFSLDNIEPAKPKVNQKLLNNMDIMKSIYKSSFNQVVNHINWTSSDIPKEDLKDIVSETFFYLCGYRHYGPEDNFTAIWMRVSELRAIDWRKKFLIGKEDLFSDDGEERFCAAPTHPVEIADIWRHIRGEKTNRICSLYYNDHLTPTEIAKEIGSTLGNVGSCITHTTQRLQKIYAKDIQQYKKS